MLPETVQKEITIQIQKKNPKNSQKQRTQKQRNNRNLEEKILKSDTKKNHNNANNCVLEINPEKNIKSLPHNHKYYSELNFRNSPYLTKMQSSYLDTNFQRIFKFQS